MNKRIIKGIFLMTFFLAITPVKAMGNATIEFSSNNTVEIGETFTVDMIVTDINNTYDGIVSFGGNLDFDESVLEYVSSKGTQIPYLFQINDNAEYKIAGLDFTLENGIRENTKVYEFTFKAIKEGKTSIGFKNAKLTDSKDYINTVVLSNDIIVNLKNNEIVDVEINKVKDVKQNIQTVFINEKKEKNNNNDIRKEIVIKGKMKIAFNAFVRNFKNKFNFLKK